ncbi:MAG: gamma-glutamyltransferase [Pirellulales bacterium]
MGTADQQRKWGGQVGGHGRVAGVGLGLLLLAGTLAAQEKRMAESPQGMVATVHPLATQAGMAALRDGGNAVDAAIAAAVTLGVVDGHNSGLGGGTLILIRTPDGQFHALDGREMAPARAHRDMYLRDGQLDLQASQTGPLAVAIPGAPAAYAAAVERFGRRPWAAALIPAARLAEEGFAVDSVYAGKLAASAPTLARFPGTRAVLLRPDGSPYRAGDVLRQPDLASTCRSLAEKGGDWFYRGPFAAAVGQWMADHGGLVTAADFAAYRVRERTPLVTTYRGHKVVGFPPPSSGGVHVAQMLQMLARYDVRELHERDPAVAAHLVVETMKRAFADRAHWLGDPDFARVPRGLLSGDYAAQLVRSIDLTRATPIESHGTPPRADEDVFEKHTTHVAAADAAGNWVALTTTVNTTFGSKVIVPGTGVILNNEMDDFSLRPGVPNAFGLLGAEANAIEPGKRPLSSMSPTIVERDGVPVLTLGAAGGPTIISQVLLGLVRYIDLEWPLDRCLSEPRFHHQWRPDEVRVEASLSPTILQGLESRGHRLHRVNGLGVSQAVSWDGQRRVFRGVADPRVPGAAAGP